MPMLLLLAECSQKHNILFTQVASSQSHISFVNEIKEDTAFNILTYEYLYNGGGVAVGDINNDGLQDIVFSGNMVSSRLYLNKGNLSFEDITEQSGFTGKPKWKTGIVMADVNGDGLMDIYACYSGPGTDDQRANELYLNQGIKNGVPFFKEEAKNYGVDAPGTYSTTAAFFDMDNDGDLDMLLVNHADMFYNPFFNTGKLRAARNPKFGNRLYRNDNNRFTDVSEEAHIAGSGLNFGLGAGISDINNDGWADIYVTNDYDERDFLYLNNQDGTFREVLDKAAGHISEFSMGCDIADYNNDLRPDVMVLDMLPEDNHRQKLLKGADAYDKYTLRVEHGFHKQQMRNTLQLNNGTDSSGTPIFSEVGELAGIAATDWSWAPLFADFDNDGWKDLFISNGIFKDITNLDFVKYTSGYSNHFEDKKGDNVNMWQIIQEMPSTPLKSYFYHNNHDLTFSDVSENWGLDKKLISNGSAYADLDNDGDLDLIVNCLGSEARILRNTTSEKNSSHYLRVKLKGIRGNTLGVGAKLYVTTARISQMQEQCPNRGFQSSVDPVMHIGLGADSIVKTLKIKWPGGKTSLLKNIKANTTITIDEATAVADTACIVEKKFLFADATKSSGIGFTHQSPAFVDFKISPLLPYQVSKTGPCLARGDANGDGLQDLFIGTSAGQESVLYLQTPDGKFLPAPGQSWNDTKQFTTVSAVFFDADGDGDNDLYLVSGGADYLLNSKNYQDRLYVNDGKGRFTLSESALPAETLSGSCVRIADIDKDGLPDIFVGGGVSPGRFPLSEECIILKNKSSKGQPRFERDTAQKDPTLIQQGIVTDAIWTDINKDGWEDLVTVGQFMPITLFENHHGVLSNKTKEYGLDSTQGWWCRIAAADFDKDGDTDIVVGNIGTNVPFNASSNEPVTITYADFNEDGVIDPVLSVYNKGKSYPFFSRDEILDQMPILQKKFSRYKDYADAQLTDMFSEEQLQRASVARINMLSSVYLDNNGHGKFFVAPLPKQAQVSMINGLIVNDVNNDGNPDLIIAGNYYPMRVQFGPMDAGIGLVLEGDGKGHFRTLPYDETGLYIPGDVRCLDEINVKGSSWLVAGKCNGPAQVIKTLRLNK